MKPTEDFKLIAKLLAGLGLDYIRWTQLVPMIIGWAFALIMVIAMALITFQGEIDSMLGRAESYIEQYFGTSQDEINSGSETASEVAGTVEFSGDDIIPWILKIWAGLALFGWIFGMLRSKYFGPKPPKKLGKKIRLASLASLIFAGLIIVLYLLLGGSNAGGPFEIIFPISIMTILLILVSIWGLTVSHVIDLLHGVLDSMGTDNQRDQAVKTTV